MALIEKCLIAVLALWALASTFYVLGFPGIYPFLVRLNRFRLWVDWSLFGASGKQAAGTSNFRFDFRDRDVSGNITEWTAGAEDAVPWTWHAFLWDPKRRVSDRIRNLGKDMRNSLERIPPAVQTLARSKAILTDYFEATQPPAPGTVREIRLVVRSWLAHAGPVSQGLVTATGDSAEANLPFHSPGSGERVILTFTAGP